MNKPTKWPIFHSKLAKRRKPADVEGDKRQVSIAAAPEEANIMIVSRMRDTAFKRVLQVVPLGTTETTEGRFGDRITASASCPITLI